MTDRTTQYPHHLAKIVAERLRAESGRSPPEATLTQLFETLYFTSLKTDEGRRILCTVNFVDPAQAERQPLQPGPDRWTFARFERPMPFDVRTLRKLGRAADPSVSSLAVYSDRKRNLFIWGMVDQEPRYGDNISLDSPVPERPGLFLVTVTGPGNISVYYRGTLVASLVQNTLVEEYHNVLWTGPVHATLRQNLLNALPNLAEGIGGRPQAPGASATQSPLPDGDGQESQFLVRAINTVCRVLVLIQQYRHGGGLLITSRGRDEDVYINYLLKYDRLPRAVLGLVQNHAHRDRARSIEQIARFHAEMEKHKGEVLGSIRFIAALSNVDGVVLLDPGLRVEGFGVELRADGPLTDVFVAGDAQGTAARMRRVDLTHFGTRHRAMMRYCHKYAGSLGFVISQDGEIQTLTRVDDRLVLWENIDVQLAFMTAGIRDGQDKGPVMRRFTRWEE